jgi:hypothetical protein
MKIFIGFLLVPGFFIIYCKPKEVTFHHTIFAHQLFGIDFCQLTKQTIIEDLQNNKIQFKCYDFFDEEEIVYNNSIAVQNKIGLIETNFFIGKGFDKLKIISVQYIHITTYDGFRIIIKFKDDYYNNLNELLKEQLGRKTLNINFNKYDEISWNANPDMSVPTCISSIILSKRLKYDDPLKAEKGVCFLEIRTRARHPHVH